MDQQRAYNLHQFQAVVGGAGPEQINNMRRQGQNALQDRPGNNGDAGGYNEWRRMNLAMRRWRDQIDPLNPGDIIQVPGQHPDVQVFRRLIPGGRGEGGGPRLPNPIENWARRFGGGAGRGGGGGGMGGQPPVGVAMVAEPPGGPPNVHPPLARGVPLPGQRDPLLAARHARDLGVALVRQQQARINALGPGAQVNGGARPRIGAGAANGRHRPLDGGGDGNPAAAPFRLAAAAAAYDAGSSSEGDDGDKHYLKGLTLDDDLLRVPERGRASQGCQFISGKPATPDSSYFEVEIVQISEKVNRREWAQVGDIYPSGGTKISIGFTALPAASVPAGLQPQPFGLGGAAGGLKASTDYNSFGYEVAKGIVSIDMAGYDGPKVIKGWPRCQKGDRIGCGLRFHKELRSEYVLWKVFFTLNGNELDCPCGDIFVQVKNERLHASVFMSTPVCPAPVALAIKVLPGDSASFSGALDMMAVDTGEDDWSRLHDVRLNQNQVLEYRGRGQGDQDVGLAQAKNPIGTRNHYFEIEIVNPGYSCYIAIGLARRSYPKNRHPGWNKGSIAYHADDGKIFVGSGRGSPFGPRCHKGDVMGCGVLFPRNYECKSDSDEELEQQGGLADLSGSSAGGAEPPRRPPHRGYYPPPLHDLSADSNGGDSDGAEDGGGGLPLYPGYNEWHNDKDHERGVVVGVYFTRNGEMIGRKEIRIPKGGFYPTIGMMGCEEKVRVDLRPLSG